MKLPLAASILPEEEKSFFHKAMEKIIMKLLFNLLFRTIGGFF